MNPQRPTFPAVPPGVDELELLALMEGEALSPTRLAEIEQALAAVPGWPEAIRAMKRDRAGLRSLVEPACPPGVIEAVEQVIERRMLIGLSAGVPLERESPPVVVLRHPSRGPSWWRIFSQDATGRRLAMAAGLLLTVGGISYLATTWYAKPSPIAVTDQGQELAKLPEEKSNTATSARKPGPHSAAGQQHARPPEGFHGVRNAESEPESGAQIAAAQQLDQALRADRDSHSLKLSEAGAGSSRPLQTLPASPLWQHPLNDRASSSGWRSTPEDQPDASVPRSAPADASTLARAGDDEPMFAYQQAFEWAQEQRLIIRITGARHEAAVARLQSSSASRRAGWVLSDQSHHEWAAAVPMDLDEHDLDNHGLDSSDRLIGASMIMAHGASGLSGPVPVMIPAELMTKRARPFEGDALMTAAVRLDHASFAAFVDALQRGGHVVRFDRADEPLPQNGQMVLPDDASMLGGSGPDGATAWQPWGWVPVVIER
jgi:hypothetical protein